MSIPNIKLPRVKDGVVKVVQVPDFLLVERMVENGFPKRIALRFMDSPQLRMEATLFYWDTELAMEGDPDATLRVTHTRDTVAAMRGAERALGNDPDTGPQGPVRGRLGIPEPVRRGDPHAPYARPGTVPTKRELRRLSERSGAEKFIILPDGEQRRIR